MMGTVDLRFGDCLAVLRELPDESVHAVICDPPYGLADVKPERVVTALTAWANGDRDHVPDGKGFMGRAWDAFVPPPAVWDECLRVLTPGGHLLAFAGSRTADLMGLSVRMAGFEIRDTIMWVYGSGFPKGQNVGKAIDKARDDRADILRVTSYLADYAEAGGITRADVDAHMGTSDMGGWWLSRLAHRCQVPRWDQWERLRELLGFGDEMDAEVWRLNGRKGTPGEAWQTAEVLRTEARMNEPSGIVNAGQGERTAVVREVKAPNSAAAAQWQGWNTSLKPAQEPIIVARKPLAGTVAANVLEHGTGAINVDACRVGTVSAADDAVYRAKCASVVGLDSNRNGDAYGEWAGTRADSASSAGRWPANVVLVHADTCHEPGGCAPGCPVTELDRQSGITVSQGGSRGASRQRSSMAGGILGAQPDFKPGFGDEGGASRYFPVFRYQAKAPASERPKIDGKGWPTVKPQGLMRWLVRLVTPPGGVVLDPFAGTGSTLQAARDEGFDSIGIERDEFAHRLACQRLGLPGLTVVPEPEPVDPVLVAIAEALTYEGLLALYAEHKAAWTDEYTSAAKTRRATIEQEVA